MAKNKKSPASLNSQKSLKSLKKEKKAARVFKKDFPTLQLKTEQEIAHDFGQKVAEKFDKMVKSVVLFGSTIKETRQSGSDIDVIIILDDASVRFDQELVAWYREELGKLIAANPYKKELHINTVKLTTWWQDLLRGDPVVINILRYGEPIVDFGGFFRPLKIMLQEGRIRPTPEAIYSALQRAPIHLAASKQSELGAVEGIYWAMVDSAHALLIAAKIMPTSPEQIPGLLAENFVDKKLLDRKYVIWYKNVFELHKRIVRGEISDIKGQDIDDWQNKADEFIRVMAELIGKLIK